MQILEINNNTLAKEFISANVHILKNTDGYIRPLDNDINDVFDKKKNKAFRNGEVVRWIAKNENGKIVGKIAAFINKKYKNKGDQFEVGGVGFFDCINDQTVANLLFDTAKNWLIQKGVKAMDGPINFGERDKFWGLVVEGFGEPLYGMNFNPPYYKQLLENYGFKPFYYQLCYGIDPQKPLNIKIKERSDFLINHEGYTVTFANKKELDKYAIDFAKVYNAAWAGHGGLKQMPEEQAKLLFKKMKVFMDEKILAYAYYQNEPVGIFINIPDLNQHFKHFNGQLGIIEKLKFLFRIKFKPSHRFTGLVFGVHPAHQGKGVDALLIEKVRQVIQEGNRKYYTDYLMQWIGDFNPKMINIAQNLGDSYVARKLCTYRCIFDSNIAFERHPIL
jgi:GNAT superfamily N-acetyltransferase